VTDALQAILQAAAARSPRFPPPSRYAGVGTAQLVTPTGRTIVYLRRRIIPPPEAFQTLHEHVVADGERLDHIAAQELGDPEQFWRICDANRATDPTELTETVGRVLRITLPQGIAGPRDV
jgi:hypothetical protein